MWSVVGDNATLQYRGVAHCAADLWHKHGPRVFFRGWTAFFLRSSPVIVCGMPLYEQARRVLGLDYMN